MCDAWSRNGNRRCAIRPRRVAHPGPRLTCRNDARGVAVIITPAGRRGQSSNLGVGCHPTAISTPPPPRTRLGGIKTRIGEPQRGQGHGPGSEQARKAQADALRRAHLQHIDPEPGRLPFGRPPSLPFRLDGGTGFAPAQAEGAPARATPPTHRPTRRRQSVGVGRRHAGDAAAASMPAGTRPPVSSYTNATDSTRRAGPPTVTHGLGDARLLAAHSLAPAICRGIRL